MHLVTNEAHVYHGQHLENAPVGKIICPGVATARLAPGTTLPYLMALYVGRRATLPLLSRCVSL